jgi:HD-GYP domain-containing protein (c-di-GMP phosphodiesterase class II)
MQLPEPTCQQIQIAGYLHDIGKVYIPLSILEKEGELDDDELSQVREHSYMTGDLSATTASSATLLTGPRIIMKKWTAAATLCISKRIT